MTALPLLITSITACVLAILFLVQTWGVIALRRSFGVPFGHGNTDDNRSLMKRARGHSNTAEQMPIFLIVLALLEFQALMPPAALAILAAAFIIGRILHALYFMDIGLHFRFRFYGMFATLMCQIIAVILLTYGLITA